MPTTDTQLNADDHISYLRRALRMRFPLAVATMVFAVLGLLTNYAGVDLLLRPIGDGSATHPLTAACLFGLGFGAFKLKRYGKAPMWRPLLGATILMICVARIMESVLSAWTGSSPLAMFGPFAGFSGRFSIEAAMVLGAFAAASLMRHGQGRWGMVFLVGGLAVVYNILLEISYGMTFFNGDVSAFTLLGLCSIAFAMTSVYIHRPFVRVSFLVGDIGSQTRIMAFSVIIIPWTCGYFLHSIKEIGGNSIPLEAAMISVITWSMLVILMTTAARHEGADAARRRAEREIAMISRTDPVTKALNRFGMTEVLEGSWLDYRSKGSLYGMILVDLDYFTRINDTFGHDAGEDVLTRVAATIFPQLRDTDALGRWGGEEFLILLKIKNRGDVSIVAERVRKALQDIRSPFCEGLDGIPVSITASFGISEMEDNDDGPTDAITRADADLFVAKEEGRSRTKTQFDFIQDEDEGLVFAQAPQDQGEDNKEDDDDARVVAAA